jgi:hypothetical protein
VQILASAALMVLLAAPARAPGAASDPAKGYTIETSGSTTSLRRGETGKLSFEIRARDGWHVDPRTPLKIDLEAPAGLELAKTRLGKKDVVEAGAESPRFEVPFTAAAAGTHEAKAKLDFFVCSADACVKQVREVTVAVAVK